MGRPWLALAFIAALAGTAAAKPWHVCKCRDDVTLPGQDAIGVPTNARLWRLVGPGLTGAPSQRFQVYELAPHTTYELSAPRLLFTTGDGPDETPPAQPTIADVTIAVHGTGSNGGGPVTLLHLAASFDADTAIVRIEVNDHAGHVTLYTTPDNLSICDPGFSINDGYADVRVTAIDLAGNASPPVTVLTASMVDASSSASCTTAHEGLGCIGFFALLPYLLTVAYLIATPFIATVRARARKAVVPAPLAITAAEELARSVRRRVVLLIAALGLAISVITGGSSYVASWHNADLRDLPGVWFLVLLTLMAVAIARWLTASRVLRLTRYDGATATVQRDEVRVTVGGQHATLRAAPWRVQRAKEAGVPKARI